MTNSDISTGSGDGKAIDRRRGGVFPPMKDFGRSHDADPASSSRPQQMQPMQHQQGTVTYQQRLPSY